ncbi:MAG TPA: hypothetical protein VMG41_15355 [Gemmatimonadales bacterium]|nr:hypothetical protein [Gemmatimonadales bacterium]
MPDPSALLPETDAQIAALGGADIALGIAAPDRMEGGPPVLEAARAALRERFPGARSVVLYAYPATLAAEAPALDGATPVLPLPWRAERRGADADAGLPVEATALILAAGQRLRATGCALLGSEVASLTPDWIGRLLAPVIEEGQDLVAPYYVRHPYSGAVTTGLLYPLVRAVYGRQLRYPMGSELACSLRLMDRVVDQAKASGRRAVELRLLVEAIAGGMPICQAALGPRPVPAEGPGLSTVLATALSLAFDEVERSAPLWQRIRGSQPVPVMGTLPPQSLEPVPLDASRMLDAFRLGQQSLSEVWGAALPPSTMVELKKLARQPDQSFRFPDRLWSRIVYDFCLAYHTRVMSRDHLMGALAPLYLGWFGAWYMEMGDVQVPALESRLEQLCLVFEAEKPYLISRWRWPDRFNP